MSVGGNDVAEAGGRHSGFDGTVERVGDRLSVIAPRGELDAYSYDGFRDELFAVQSGHVVVDLTDVTFVDSLTLGAVVQATRRARARGDELIVVCPDAHTRKVIEITGLGSVLALETSLPDAVTRSLTR